MTVRRLWVLVSRLPPESYTQAIAMGLPGEGLNRAVWTPQMHLLANLYDLMNELRHTYVSAHSKRPPKAPKPFPRPGIKET